jgi:3-oxoacyl-[acyl-carrier-protein] synthase III
MNALAVRITSTGLYAPARVETAEDLAPKAGKSVEWILERTGVARRHVSDGPVEKMAAEAARQALGDSKPDLILYASATPRQLVPDTSVFVQRELGLDGIACHSVHATCLSFLVALHTAAAFITVGAYRKVLIVSAEMGSLVRNFSEPESAVLPGDGAAAAVVEATPPGEGSSLLGYAIGMHTRAAEAAEVRGMGARLPPNGPDTRPEDNLFHMNGTLLFRLAMVHIGPLLDRLFAETGLGPKDIKLVVPHQPSKPGVESLERWGFPAERVVNIVGEYGNCIAASMPMALATAHAQGRLARGDRVLLIGTGAGMSIGAAILEW